MSGCFCGSDDWNRRCKPVKNVPWVLAADTMSGHASGMTDDRKLHKNPNIGEELIDNYGNHKR